MRRFVPWTTTLFLLLLTVQGFAQTPDPLGADLILPPGKHTVALTMLAGPKAPPEEIWMTVVVPENQELKPLPVILALPPGAGDGDMVEWVLRGYWENEGRKRGYILISPELNGPAMQKKAKGFLQALFQFMDQRLIYDPARVALTGVSNGGIALWPTALAAPERFAAILGLPAAWDGEGEALAPLKDIPTWLIVGAKDKPFKKYTRKNGRALKAAGGNPTVTVLKGQEHVVRIPSRELYDWLDRVMPPGPLVDRPASTGNAPPWLKPSGQIFRGHFSCAQGTNNQAGLWFPLQRGETLYLGSAYHLFGPPADLKSWVPDHQLDDCAADLKLHPLDGSAPLKPADLEQILLGVGFGPDEELVDAVLFRTSLRRGLEPFYLAMSLPQKGDVLWVLVPGKKGAAEARRGRAETLSRGNKHLAFTLDEGELPPRSSGAPVLNEAGEVVGVLSTGGGQIEGRPRFGAVVLPTMLLKGLG